MYDTQHLKKMNCTIEEVKRAKGSFPDEVQITVNTDEGIELVKVMSPRMYKEQLEEMKQGKRERCIWAYGMADVDLFKVDEDQYMLLNSPHEGLYIRYFLATGQFEKLQEIG